MHQGKPSPHKVMWREDEIAYCANVHPGTQAEDIEQNIADITAKVRQQSQLNTMYAGLWVCENALKQYQATKARQRLKQCLADNSLCVVTLNGFPQGDFHQPVVKENVYQPNWLDSSRLDYTQKLAQLLAEIMPEDIQQGSISTLPIAYKQHWPECTEEKVCQHLLDYAKYADELASKTGKQIRLCLEMEPGCVLEKTPELIVFFQQILIPYVQSAGEDISLVKQYLGICYDICHQAVMQEDIGSSLRALDNAGIVIGKVQVSSALKADLSAGPEVLENLRAFAEPKYLHQVSASNDKEDFLFADDLTEAFENTQFLASKYWYIHYHLPLQTNDLDSVGLSTTRCAIEEFLESVKTLPYVPHMEIETYTWQVLPENQRPKDKASLIQGLCAERTWLLEAMRVRGLI